MLPLFWISLLYGREVFSGVTPANWAPKRMRYSTAHRYKQRWLQGCLPPSVKLNRRPWNITLIKHHSVESRDYESLIFPGRSASLGVTGPRAIWRKEWWFPSIRDPQSSPQHPLWVRPEQGVRQPMENKPGSDPAIWDLAYWWNWVPLKPSFSAKFMINLPAQNFTSSFLVPHLFPSGMRSIKSKWGLKPSRALEGLPRDRPPASLPCSPSLVGRKVLVSQGSPESQETGSGVSDWKHVNM